MAIRKKNKCDGCGEPFSNGGKVTAVIQDVEVSDKTRNGDLRLKLSEKNIINRSIKIYCKICLDLGIYTPEEK